MIARSILRDYVREMYQGDITTSGDATVWPHDKMYMHDEYNDMKGLSLVKRVNIHFSRATGFTNVVSLAPYAYVKGDKKLLELTAHSHLMGSAALWLSSAISNWRLAAIGCNTINRMMYDVLGYLSYVGIYGSRTAYYKILQELGEKMIDFGNNPYNFMKDYQKIATTSELSKDAEQFLAKEIFAKVNSKYTTSKVMSHYLTNAPDDVAKTLISLLEADSAAALENGSVQAAETMAGKMIESMGREKLQGVMTKEIAVEAVNLVKAARAAKVAGATLGAEVGGVAEKAILGEFLALMGRNALTKIIVKAAFRGPFTLIWTGFGWAFFGPAGLLVGSVIGTICDAILFHLLISVPLTMFNRYFDDACSLDMSLLTYRGREFSAGINGHRLNTGVVYAIPREVTKLDYDETYKDKMEESLGARMAVMAQHAGSTATGTSSVQSRPSSGVLNDDLVAAAKAMVGKQYPLTDGNGNRAYWCAPGVMDMLKSMGVQSSAIANKFTLGNHNPNWVPDWFLNKDAISTTIGEDKGQWIPGDIILFRDGTGDGTNGYNWHHIAVYVGNNQMIHVSSSRNNTTVLTDVYNNPSDTKVIAIRLDPAKIGSNISVFNNGTGR